MGKMLIPLRSCVVASTWDTDLGMLYFDVDWDCPLDIAVKALQYGFPKRHRG